MCHPAVIAGVTAVASLAGGFIQGQGAQDAANAEAAAEERRAAMAERQQAINQTQASFERRRTLDQYQKVIGNNVAAGSERGLSDTGSLVDVMDDNAFEVSQDLEAIRFRAEGEQDNLAFEASEARQRAVSKRKAGKTAKFGAILGGVTGAVTTLGQSFYRRPLRT
ncbi:virion core protein, T7 gp14 family [Roseibium sediminis]|uniref:virion core protein, T7 gp14 family n=1 Tax=Roseibium sediminis TaxID=1775174 RepID=UPI00123CD9A3|nr:hypothetical protein [Roseibium sediminis]